jgi:transmembrane 9 superfamily protein 3
MVGQINRGGLDNDIVSYYLYTHRNFSISYNKDRIVEVNVTNSEPVMLDSNSNSLDLKFTYSAVWTPTTASFANRWGKYLDSDFFEVFSSGFN